MKRERVDLSLLLSRSREDLARALARLLHDRPAAETDRIARRREPRDDD